MKWSMTLVGAFLVQVSLAVFVWSMSIHSEHSWWYSFLGINGFFGMCGGMWLAAYYWFVKEGEKDLEKEERWKVLRWKVLWFLKDCVKRDKNSPDGHERCYEEVLRKMKEIK